MFTLSDYMINISDSSNSASKIDLRPLVFNRIERIDGSSLFFQSKFSSHFEFPKNANVLSAKGGRIQNMKTFKTEKLNFAQGSFTSSKDKNKFFINLPTEKPRKNSGFGFVDNVYTFK